MKNITEQVNEVYNEENPSTYFSNDKDLIDFVSASKEFLLKLKLPPKIFQNSNLIDFGCGTGQNSLVYDHLGAKCTLLEYDKFSYQNATSLFNKSARNKYEIHNIDIFKYKFLKESYDIVISNGVAQHTKDPIENVKLCMEALKPGGFLLLGVGNKSGFFQRNLQRFILYSISDNKEEITQYAKILFKDHLQRAKKFSGRSIEAIIFDTYVNPKIYNFGTKEILELFSQNNLSLYSSYYDLKFVNKFLETDTNQFKYTSSNSVNFDKKNNLKDVILSDLEDLTLSNNGLNNKEIFKQLNTLTSNFNLVSDGINDINFSTFKNINTTEFLKNLELYKTNVSKLNKIDILNKSHNKIFLEEVLSITNILNKKLTKTEKFNEIKGCLGKSKHLFKHVNGVGLNYYTGYKHEK